MEKVELKKKPYASFNEQFTGMFSLENWLPHNVFNHKFNNFHVYDMDYFYEEIGWKWILENLADGSDKHLFFTTVPENNTDYTVAEIPISLEPKKIIEQIDILENESKDVKNTFFLTFEEACLFSNAGNWGLYFVREFNFVILATEETFVKSDSFLNLESMTVEEFTEHFQDWSAWTEKGNRKYLKTFNKIFFCKQRVRKMIYLKGITTAGAYDNREECLEEIHEDIKKIMKRLILHYDIYQFHLSHKFDDSADKSVLVKETRFRKTYANFYKEKEERFDEGSNYDKYLLAEKDSDFSKDIDKLKLSEMPTKDNLRAELLAFFPLIVILSDSSELMAYSADMSILELV
ncbi:hypothetical protein [Listeria marthii]|uniref:hypothetical protein n=1 Tax=Listeria marthii TaxID=529731 RepID=UPI0021CDB18C|nr:hypothetical protein [Listeria marthii]